jgi:uncharacterized protein (TIGR02996 family)
VTITQPKQGGHVNEEEGLLGDIATAPENDAPRLVYADWLEDHDPGPRDREGTSLRAEFIRLQCQLARLPADDPERARLEAREQELLPAQTADWLERLGKYGVTDVVLRRGLPEEVTISAADFIGNMGEVLDAAPVRGATVFDCRDVEALAACPHLAKLTALDLNWNHIDAVGAEALASSPRLANLMTLHLDGNNIGNAGAEALATSPHLTNLVALHLDGNNIGNAGAAALAASPYLAGLILLDLRVNDIDTVGARALAYSPHLTHLASLAVGYNDIGPEGVEALAGSRHLPNLTRLDLGANPRGDVSLREIQRRLEARRHSAPGRGRP